MREEELALMELSSKKELMNENEYVYKGSEPPVPSPVSKVRIIGHTMDGNAMKTIMHDSLLF